MPTTGGRDIGRLIKSVRERRVTTLTVGVRPGTKYDDGTLVATAALANEFGTKAIPERPFFRQAIGRLERPMRDILKREVDPKTMAVTPRIAEIMGRHAQQQIRDGMAQLRVPPNTPHTLERKEGDNPLLDSKKLSDSMEYWYDVDKGNRR